MRRRKFRETKDPGNLVPEPKTLKQGSTEPEDRIHVLPFWRLLSSALCLIGGGRPSKGNEGVSTPFSGLRNVVFGFFSFVTPLGSGNPVIEWVQPLAFRMCTWKVTLVWPLTTGRMPWAGHGLCLLVTHSTDLEQLVRKPRGWTGEGSVAACVSPPQYSL